jgi:hypothetical protein
MHAFPIRKGNYNNNNAHAFSINIRIPWLINDMQAECKGL